MLACSKAGATGALFSSAPFRQTGVRLCEIPGIEEAEERESSQRCGHLRLDKEALRRDQ
jgi:hypothetical protein